MEVFEFIIALLLGGAVFAAVARRISVPYPALVAVAGAALALIPGVPAMVLDPDLALALFVAPVLLDAAFDASQRDLRANWRAVLGLALGAVLLTVIVVAAVAQALVPGLSLAAALALGAIVAPPDAAAATAVLKQLRPPHRLLVVLEGESLFNDASALLIYRFAVAAAITGLVSGWWTFAGTLLLVGAGSVALAWVLSYVISFFTARIEDVSTAVIVQFCSTFAVWVMAERLKLSPILTMVVYAMLVSRRAAMIPARVRVPSYAVWEVAVFILNVLAFILVGFQLREIVVRADWPRYIGVASAVCVAVIVARLVWVTSAAAISRWRCRPGPGGSPGPRDVVSLSGKAAYVVGWCGMRGIVTLATALALPINFPHRDLIFFTSFSVVLVTLVVQGLTLRPLIRWLGVRDDGTVDREVQIARTEALRAGLEAIAQHEKSETSDILRRRYEIRLRHAERGDDEDDPLDHEVARAATAAERQRLIELREDGTIGDAAFQQVEQELDLRELDLLQLSES